MISIHALREEGDTYCFRSFSPAFISIHALREEGDGSQYSPLGSVRYFYPRPPRGGRLDSGLLIPFYVDISIHALREEGDWASVQLFPQGWNFYPRPPRGGRPLSGSLLSAISQFLSTPSARRATAIHSCDSVGAVISIHALREEGDPPGTALKSRPRWISIHALREEGDQRTSP